MSSVDIDIATSDVNQPLVPSVPVGFTEQVGAVASLFIVILQVFVFPALSTTCP